MSAEVTYDRRSIWSWAFYDFANSPFTTLIVTFIYSQYFVGAIAPDPILGTLLWSRGVTITALVVAFSSPFLGALADRGGYRKAFLMLATAICIVGSVALYGILPGETIQALIWFVIANVGYECAGVFYNAFLPDIAPRDQIGRISGYGWALGYVGALLALIIALATLVQPEIPWFGFSKDNGENIRAANLLVALWFAVFSLPILLWVKEDKSQISTTGGLLSNSLTQLRSSFQQIRQYRQIVRFLMARLLYNDGLVTVFAFAGIYAASTFGFETRDILILGIVLNVTSGIGAFVMGHLDDRWGGKATIQVTLIGLSVATVIAIAAPNRLWFWIAGIVVGIFVGPNQSASRSLMGRFVPPEKENEFFGFFAFSGKLTAFLGPFFFGLLTDLFDSQRAGISVVLILLIAGGLVLTGVDEQEGIETAGR